MRRLTLAAARAAASLLSPAGDRARLSIFIYHRVHIEPDPLLPAEVTAERFKRQLDAIASVFNLLPLPGAIERLRSGTLPARAACLTFDDGYRDNREVALPILREFGAHATFFVATGFLDGGRMWNDSIVEAVRRSRRKALDLREIGLGQFPLNGIEQRRKMLTDLIGAIKYLPPLERQRAIAVIETVSEVDLPRDLMMSSNQVRELADAGMEIGGHTVSHPILANLDADGAEQEIQQGRERLRQIVGREVRLFAYPNGKPDRDYHPEHTRLVRNLGFDAALSTAGGVSGKYTDPYQLPRFTPWDLRESAFIWRAVDNLRRPI
jgi:peptidoglycan/xylan/chitin deacetylase (PgdA/CDA1 family)